MTNTQLLGRDACIALIFAPESRPSPRTWEAWKARRMIAAAQKRAARSKSKGPQASTPSGSVLARYSVLKGKARSAFYATHGAAIWAARAKEKAKR